MPEVDKRESHYTEYLLIDDEGDTALYVEPEDLMNDTQTLLQDRRSFSVLERVITTHTTHTYGDWTYVTGQWDTKWIEDKEDNG